MNTPYTLHVSADEFIICPKCSTDLNYRAEQLFEEQEELDSSTHSCPHCGTQISVLPIEDLGFTYLVSASI